MDNGGYNKSAYNNSSNNVWQPFSITSSTAKSPSLHTDTDATAGNDHHYPLSQPSTAISNQYYHEDPHNFFINHRGELEKRHGLGWVVTGLFIAGYSAGAGIVALTAATVRAGVWLAVSQLLVMAIIATYTAHTLGQSWLIVLRRWPEYQRSYCRKPYAELAYRAVGWRMRNATSIILSLNQFGIGVVFMLLCAKNVHHALRAFLRVNISECVLIVVVALALLPIIFLKSPQDFWGAVVAALCSTTTAVVLILAATALDFPECSKAVRQEPLTTTNFFLALGTFIFSYAGHGVFPNIQHDMRRPYQATRASVLAFSFMSTLYLPVCILGYYTYGSSISESIIDNLQNKWIQQAVNLLITVHCFLSLTTVFNPVNLEAEEFFNAPHHFCLKRVVVRLTIVVLAVLVAETIPHFGPLVNLMGGSTLSLMNLVFPCWFYLSLRLIDERKARGDHYPPSTLSLRYWRDVCRNTEAATLFCNIAIIVLGLMGGVAATYAAVLEIRESYKFEPPCYAGLLFHEASNSINNTTGKAVSKLWDETSVAFFKCCGGGGNISRYGSPEIYCER